MAVLLGAVLAATPTLVPAPALAADDDDFFGDDDEEEEDEGEFEEEEEEEEEDYDQPPRWAGGLYTKRTWPQSFVQRNLILIGGMTQAKAAIDIDISDRTAFDVWRAIFDLRYGVADTFQLHGGANVVLTGEVSNLTASGPYNAFFYFGFENSIAFELVNFNLTGEIVYIDTSPADVRFNIGFGFPFRYRFNKKVAIYALERLMTINTTSVEENGVVVNGADPDFNLGLSLAFQPVKELAIRAGVRVNVADFNFKDNSVYIPAYLGVLFAPKNNFDLGLQFSFNNLKPIDPDETDDEEPAFYDQRSFQVFAQLRL